MVEFCDRTQLFSITLTVLILPRAFHVPSQEVGPNSYLPQSDDVSRGFRLKKTQKRTLSEFRHPPFRVPAISDFWSVCVCVSLCFLSLGMSTCVCCCRPAILGKYRGFSYGVVLKPPGSISSSRFRNSRVFSVRASMVDSYGSSSNFAKRMEQAWLISQVFNFFFRIGFFLVFGFVILRVWCAGKFDRYFFSSNSLALDRFIGTIVWICEEDFSSLKYTLDLCLFLSSSGALILRE